MARIPHPLLALVVAGGLLSAMAGAQERPPAADPLRLPETLLPGLQPLIDGALAAAPRVLQARLALAAKKADEQDAQSGLYPHANVSANVDGRQEVQSDPTSIRYRISDDYGASSSLPLYHWGALAKHALIGKIQRQLAENDLAEARRNLVIDLRSQYTGLILRARDLEQAGWDDRRHARQLQRDEDRAAHGEVPALDLAAERLDAGDSARTVKRLQFEWDQARQDFADLAGMKEFAAANLPSDIPPVPDWTARLRPEPAPDLPDGPVPAALAAVNEGREEARLNLDIASVRLRPVLDLVAGVTQDFVVTGVQVRYVGLQISWNIWDGWASQAAVSHAHADLRQKTLAYDQAAQALRRQITEGWTEMELDQEELVGTEARYAQMSARLAADLPLRNAGQISDEDWDKRQFDLEQWHLTLLRLRSAQLLRVAEYALLRERGTQPPASIHFP